MFSQICKDRVIISIHALCEEGDRDSSTITKNERGFLSTPSARRATRREDDEPRRDKISIHALCEEGDGDTKAAFAPSHEFLSTPSARRATHSKRRTKSAKRDFYPRPLRGGRREYVEKVYNPVIFLSTPSARRATRFLAANGTRE